MMPMHTTEHTTTEHTTTEHTTRDTTKDTRNNSFGHNGRIARETLNPLQPRGRDRVRGTRENVG